MRRFFWRCGIVHAICSSSSSSRDRRTTRPPIRDERVSASCSPNAADERRFADGKRGRQEWGASESKGSLTSARPPQSRLRVHDSIPGLRSHGRAATFSSDKERRQPPFSRQPALLFSAAEPPLTALRSVITGTEIESGFGSLTAQRQNDPPSILPAPLSCSAS